MKTILFSFVTALLIISITSFKSPSPFEPVAVIELFTSQGCSSCPPADVLLSKTITDAKENGKKYVRLDTVGDNKGLIKHYTSCGFDFLGLFKLKNTAGLPPHYHNATVSLFELAV